MIYKLHLKAQNPSAYRSGYFLSLEEVEETIERWKTITGNNPNYYRGVEFEIEKIETGEEYFY